MNIKARPSYVILEAVNTENVSASGLVFQEDTSKNSLKKGSVVSCDDLPAGTTVYYPQDKSWTISEAGESYVAVRTEDVIATGS